MDVIRWFDRVLRSIGRNGGSSIREPVIRLFFMESILVTTIFAAWYLSGPLSPFGLMSILIAAFYVLGIHRVWSENEKLRREIAQRIIDDDPDQHPDLRLNVLIVSMHLIVIVPLLLWRLNDVFNIYSVHFSAILMLSRGEFHVQPIIFSFYDFIAKSKHSSSD